MTLLTTLVRLIRQPPPDLSSEAISVVWLSSMKISQSITERFGGAAAEGASPEEIAEGKL
jgi:hypothetical protein